MCEGVEVGALAIKGATFVSPFTPDQFAPLLFINERQSQDFLVGTSKHLGSVLWQVNSTKGELFFDAQVHIAMAESELMISI